MEKIWLKSYPKGIPEEVPTPPFVSVKDLFERTFKKYPSNAAFTNMGKTLDYSELDILSMQFAKYLQNVLGLKQGERVAIMLPNILQYPVAMCGIFRAGLVVVNVNPLYTARELEHQLKDSGAKCVIILKNFAHILEKVIERTEINHVVTTGVGDLLSWPKSILINIALKYFKRSIPNYKLNNEISFKQVLKFETESPLKSVNTKPSDIAFLQYTGGTTGISKGAILSHRNMVYNVQQTIVWQADAYDDDKPIVAITALPLYHIFSLECNCLTMMAQGGENVLITNPRDFENFAKEIAKFNFSLFTGVNTMFAALMDTPSFSKINFEHLRVCIGGGMAVQPAIAKEWKEKTGITLLQAYGLTETSPAAIVSPIKREFTGSIGLPISSTEVIIADDTYQPLPIGESGEICIRGPQVMQGYWNRPKETADVMSADGWFRTGDIGYFNDDGYVFIEDRKKDMIIVSGFNVYPNEIENVVVELEDVLEAAAIGIPDERSGEIVKIFVVRKNDKVSKKEITDHCKNNLTGYKRPKIIEFRDELPKTNVGKILRRGLRD